MQCQMKVVTLTMCTLFVLCTRFTGSDGREAYQHKLHNRLKRQTDDERLFTEESMSPIPTKRECNGFPCMYTHLGSKMGKASIYKAMASYVNNCFSDPLCGPGRRKRTNPEGWKAEKIINTPLIDIILWRLGQERQERQ